jgi:hypothetical protein
MDDASPSQLGIALREQLSKRHPSVTWDIHRIVKSQGYRATMDRMIFALNRIACSGIQIDYFLRVDADLFINRGEVSELFSAGRLPARGLVGSVMAFRWRDYVQVFLDLLPFGWRRKQVDGKIGHAWSLTRPRPVWWSDFGRRAVCHGLKRRYVHGAFMIMAGETLRDLQRSGWLDRQPSAGMGLVFGDDVMASLLVRGLGDPLLDFNSIVPGWHAEMFLDAKAIGAASGSLGQYHLLHPLKGDPVGLELRRSLSDRAPGEWR